LKKWINLKLLEKNQYL